MSEVRLASIVPTLDRPEDIAEFVESLVQQTVPTHQLVVVDAGKDPRIEDILRKGLEGSGIELLYSRSKPGTSLQRNIALEQFDADIVFFFDDDVLLEPDYVEKTLECFEMERNPPVGCVLGTFSSPSRERGWRQRYFHLFGMTHSIPGDAASVSRSGGVRWLIDPPEVVPVPVASGGRTAYRSACLTDERFDEFLPGYTMSEDVEFSHRIAQEWTILQTPKARLFHKRSPTARVNYGDRVSRLLYSRFYFFKKHIAKQPLNLLAFGWTVLGISTFYIGVSAVKSGQGGRFGAARGVVSGYRRCINDLLGRELD